MSDLTARAFMVQVIQGVKCLVPSDPFAMEFMGPLKVGFEILVSTRRPRSMRQHKLLFALLRKVIDNSDKWADTTVLLDDLKLATGLFETRFNAFTGLPYPVPSSISIASMDGERFSAWFQKAIAVLARDVFHTLPETVQAEIESMLEPRKPRLWPFNR